MKTPELPGNEVRGAAGAIALLAAIAAAWCGQGWFALVFLVAFLQALAGEADRHIALQAFLNNCEEWRRRPPD
jgi:hypothetical protein